MSSIMAAQVAEEVLKKVIRGEKPNVSKIAIETGYSKYSALANKPQQTKTYQNKINLFIQKLEKERNRILAAMSQKDLSFESHRDLTYSFDKLTQNIQLLSGGATQNVAIGIISADE